ncbi:MAG: radical SAM protein [bacterium]
MHKPPRSLLIFSRSKRQRLNVSGYFPMAPLGISTLAASLREAGYPVELLDSHVVPGGDAGIFRFLEENRFEHVGLSAGYFSAEHAILLADMVKQYHPETVVSMGGPAALFKPEQILRYTRALDIIVHGEGERAIVGMVRAIEKEGDLGGIPGTSFIRDGAVRTVPKDEPLIMDDVPRPLLELLPLKKYRLHPPFGVYPPGQYIESARGCPYRCVFCTLPKEIRTRSPKLVVEDVKHMIGKYGVRELHFVDPTFTFHRERVLAICEGLKQAKLSLHWTCKTRCDLVDREMLEAMAGAGCYSISYGVETAAQAILDFYQKDIAVKEIEDALFETKRAGIRALAYMLIGSQGETDETVRRTMAMMRRYNPDFVLYAQLLPDPCSVRAREDIERGIYTESEILDYYLGGKTDLLDERGVFGTPQSQIHNWIARAFSDFYARPSYIIRRLRDIRSLHDLTNHFRAFLVLLADRLGLTKTVG